MKIDVYVWSLEILVTLYMELQCKHPTSSDVASTIDAIKNNQPIGYFTLVKGKEGIYNISDGYECLNALTDVLMTVAQKPDKTQDLYYNYKTDIIECEPSNTNISLSTVYNGRSFHKFLDTVKPLPTEADLIQDLHHKLHTYKVPCYVLYQPQTK